MPEKYLLLNEKYINYWNTWHWHWYLQAKKWLSNGHLPQTDDYFSWVSPRSITTYSNNRLGRLWELQEQHKLENGWRVPFKGKKPAIGKDETESWKFFPVPYWGDPDNSLLKAAFLSLNHQHPVAEQNMVHGTYKKLYDTYHKKDNEYHETVKSLLHDQDYSSNRKYQAENLEVASRLIQLLDPKDSVKPEDVIQFFLVPWQTDSAKEISTTYIQENVALIYNRVLEPVAKLSAELVSPLSGVVIMRWNNLHKIDFPQFKVYHFNDQVPEEKTMLDVLNSDQNGWSISYFKVNKATFVNFSFHGGTKYPRNIGAVRDVIAYAKHKSEGVYH
jgi:hypothetical protein